MKTNVLETLEFITSIIKKIDGPQFEARRFELIKMLNKVQAQLGGEGSSIQEPVAPHFKRGSIVNREYDD